jgi:radical SAM superfamily enzyme YgiQ (UPF0313 family)
MITVINPPNPPNAVSNKDTMGGVGQLYPAGAKHSFPPMDLLYSTSYLRARNIPVQVIECLGLNWELAELVLHLNQTKPELVALRTSAPTVEWDIKIAEIIKLSIHTKILFFGPYVTLCANEVLESASIDAVIIGEPEIAVYEAASKGEFQGCEGIWYKHEGVIRRNPQRASLLDLDVLPFPAWDMVPYQSYNGVELMRNLKPFVTSSTSRGCPHGCAYCPYPVAQGRKLRMRSIENVVEELEWLSKALGVKAVLFRDPEFAFYKERVMDLCERIIQRGIRLAWRCETRMEDLDQDLIPLMAKAGCIGINMGVESTDIEVLQTMKRKPFPLDEAKRIIKTCRKHHVDSFCFFILGLPRQTRASAVKTIRYALELNPDFLQFTVATPYPGTELREWAEKNKFIEEGSAGAMTGYNVTMRNEHMTSDEIRDLQWIAHEAREMRWQRIGQRLLQNVLRIGSEFRRCIRFWRAKARTEL